MWFSVNLVPAKTSRLLNKEAPLSYYMLSTTSASVPAPLLCCSAAAAAASACALMPVIRAMSPSNVPFMRAIFACHTPCPHAPFPTRHSLRKYQRLIGIYQAATCCNFWARGSCQDKAEQTEGWGEEAAKTEKTKQMTEAATSISIAANATRLDNVVAICYATPPPCLPPLYFNLIYPSKSGNPSPRRGMGRRVPERLLLSRLRDDA